MLLFEFEEEFPTVKTYTVDELAQQHGVDVKAIRQQLAKGIKVEKEHTTTVSQAKDIALDHIAEHPDYYDRLSDANLEEEVVDFPDRKKDVTMDKLRSKSSYYNKSGSPTDKHPDLRPKPRRLKSVK